MKLKTENFSQQVQRKFQQSYLISGDELFLTEDCLSLLRKCATKHGITTFKYLSIQSEADWQSFALEVATQSLFVEQKAIICRFKPTFLNKKNDQKITELVQNLPTSTVVFFMCPKLTPAQKKKQLVYYFSQQGTHLAVWPLDEKQLLTWGLNKSKHLKIQLTSAQLATIIASCCQEPLLIANALELLSLTYPQSDIPEQALNNCWGSHSSQSVFQIIDHAMTGNLTQFYTAFRSYQQQNNSPMSLFYLTFKTINDMWAIHQKIAQGQQPIQAIKHIIKWPIKQPLYSKACQRHTCATLEAMIVYCSKTDQTVKGLAPGQPWHQLEWLLMTLADPKCMTSLKLCHNQKG